MNGSRGIITVNGETCVVCGACAAVCPTEALVVEGLALVVLQERCRPCGIAALVCPTGALTCPGGRRPRPADPHHGTRRGGA